MSASTAALSRVGQSLWLDQITRGLLDDGTLARFIRELHVTGLTSNPSIYNLAVKGTSFGRGGLFRNRDRGPDAGGRSLPAGV